MKLLTLYARHEPTTDAYVGQNSSKKDVCIYRDWHTTQPVARFGWHQSHRPTKRNKYVTINCYRWRLVWIDDNAKPNARFWIIWNGQHTKLTLAPGQCVSLYEWHRTDEGYSSTFETYEYDADDGVIRNVIQSDARDCDGRISDCSEWVCPLDRLHANERPRLVGEYEEGEGAVSDPAWERESARQRDYAAEAMGY